MFLDPNTPVFNSCVFYFLFIIIIITIKPNFLYCHKEKKFKAFGCNDNNTIFNLPLLAISFAITIYVFFLGIKIFSDKLID